MVPSRCEGHNHFPPEIVNLLFERQLSPIEYSLDSILVKPILCCLSKRLIDSLFNVSGLCQFNALNSDCETSVFGVGIIS